MQTALPLFEGSFQRNKVIEASISLVSSDSSTSQGSDFLILGSPSQRPPRQIRLDTAWSLNPSSAPCMHGLEGVGECWAYL